MLRGPKYLFLSWALSPHRTQRAEAYWSGQFIRQHLADQDPHRICTKGKQVKRHATIGTRRPKTCRPKTPQFALLADVCQITRQLELYSSALSTRITFRTQIKLIALLAVGKTLLNTPLYLYESYIHFPCSSFLFIISIAVLIITIITITIKIEIMMTIITVIVEKYQQCTSFKS